MSLKSLVRPNSRDTSNGSPFVFLLSLYSVAMLLISLLKFATGNEDLTFQALSQGWLYASVASAKGGVLKKR